MNMNCFLGKCFVFLVVSAFWSCKEKTPATSVVAVNTDTLAKKEIQLGTFSTSPETDSCACFFSTDSTAYRKGIYIFAYDLETISYVRINGTMTKFNQIEYSVIDDNSLTTFQSDPYKLYLELKDVRETGKEATLQSGSIRIMDNQGNVTITPFYGECSCKNPGRK